MLVALKSNHYAILQYTIEYCCVPQQRCMCIANDYSYFTIFDDLITGQKPKHIYHQPLLKSGLTWYLRDNEANQYGDLICVPQIWVIYVTDVGPYIYIYIYIWQN